VGMAKKAGYCLGCISNVQSYRDRSVSPCYH
jgi:hypothetical protein